MSQKCGVSARDIRSLTLLFVICLLTDRFEGDSGGISSGDEFVGLGEGLDPGVIARTKAL
jgi:hypothetical protein